MFFAGPASREVARPDFGAIKPGAALSVNGANRSQSRFFLELFRPSMSKKVKGAADNICTLTR
jgi:hypothetical protein